MGEDLCHFVEGLYGLFHLAVHLLACLALPVDLSKDIAHCYCDQRRVLEGMGFSEVGRSQQGERVSARLNVVDRARGFR